MKRTLMAAALGLALAPAVLHADNLTVGTATEYVVGQGWMFANAPTGGRWYAIGVVAGRSYCAETAVNDFSNVNPDTGILVKAQNTTTTLFDGDEYPSEPSADQSNFGPTRSCWISPVTDTRAYLELYDFNLSENVRFRVTDTSIWCPWFVSGSPYTAFVLMKNTTNHAWTVNTTLYTPAGAVIGVTQSTTIPANGSIVYQLDAAPFSLPAGTAGTIQVSHNGPPGAIVANATTISFSAGVSFDTPFSARADYRQ